MMDFKKLICVAALFLIQTTSIYAACNPREVALDVDISESKYSTTKVLDMVSLTFGSLVDRKYISTTTYYGYAEGQTQPSEKIGEGRWIICVPEKDINLF